jgi:hypothetical protein
LVLPLVLQHHAQVLPRLAVGGIEFHGLPIRRGGEFQFAAGLLRKSQVELEGRFGRTLLHGRTQQQQGAIGIAA